MKSTAVLSSEHHEYYRPYIDLVRERSLLEAFAMGMVATANFFNSLPEEKLLYTYANGKWTPQEILLHIIDTERVFCYRALQIARAKNVDLEGFDQDIFADNSYANDREIDSLVSEYSAVRHATICLFKSFSQDILLKTGKANNSTLSVRAAGFIICGHELHHIQIIKDRYLI